MTKPAKSNRTLPLDRDGDGHNGGSLPGNQTAPMADAETAKTPDDLADARTTPGDAPEKLEAIEREVNEGKAATELLEDLLLVDEGSGFTDALTLAVVTGWADDQAQQAKAWAAAAGTDGNPDRPDAPDFLKPFMLQHETAETIAAKARAASGWERDEARLLEKLDLINLVADVEAIGLTTAEVVATFSDQEAFEAEAFADAMLAEGRQTNDDGDVFNADGSPIALPFALSEWIFLEPGTPIEQSPLDAIAEAEPDLVATTRQDVEDGADDATFDDEQVAAGAFGNDVAREAFRSSLDHRDQAQTAVRIRELSVLVNARRLYKSAQGYSETHGAPYIADTTVQAWIAAGLAEDIPSAGNHGGVKLTHEARRLLTELKHGVQA